MPRNSLAKPADSVDQAFPRAIDHKEVFESVPPLFISRWHGYCKTKYASGRENGFFSFQVSNNTGGRSGRLRPGVALLR